MEKVGNSSVWSEKYRPQTVTDLILPARYKNLLKSFIDQGEIQNLLLSGSAGCGKTSASRAICNDLECDVLFINGSMETSIDTLRYKVQQFAMTSSLNDGKKVVIIDEFERISIQGQDATKGLIEQAMDNCRFIFTTNNLAKIIDPLRSRTQLIEFNFNDQDKQEMLLGFLKRIIFILSQESVEFDKKSLAEFITKKFPDFRKIINELQKFSKMNSSIDSSILLSANEATFDALITELKGKKFNGIRKAVTAVEPDTFYTKFYLDMDVYLQDDCKADVIMTLGKYAYQHGISADKEINLLACIMELSKDIKWK